MYNEQIVGRPLNAEEVLANVLEYREENRSFPIDKIYRNLNIFDWWPETLSKSRLDEMAIFLREAIKLGYTGYVCFKVGASGCANGMWAHKENSVDGYSPKDSESIYRSFTPEYTYWSICKNNTWYPRSKREFNDPDCEYDFDSLKTISMFEKYINTQLPV